MFTETEIKLIDSAVRSYLQHEEVVEPRNSILAKIRTTMQMHQFSRRFKTAVKYLRTTPYKVITSDLPDTPVFRFVEAPEELQFRTLLPSGYGSYPTHSATYVNGGITLTRHTNPQSNITLTKYESEILLAFLLFHKLKERGIDHSGLPTEALSAERS